MVPFSFCSVDMCALPEGGLFHAPSASLLLADLHLEKASSYAARGQMLPPYDSIETLRRVAALVDRTGARALYCLGDSFHDRAGIARLGDEARGLLSYLTARTRWTWIVGNHDAAFSDPLGGHVVSEAELAGLWLRHEADPADPRPEVSGHYHPKLKITLRGRRVSRPCFVVGRTKLILPSFGVLTGGMDAADPVILRTVGRDARALLAVQEKLLGFPLAA
ncbi:MULTISPECIES: ligase-associated DNA damage response endonuclease PdeM [unclassified Sphingomonas]|uniref:ligase-associated DNA damage response endonuclease PdeM n=1 Tax=unclassified Sphingomonas TaxID=196159 RepID=UPI0006F48905|nr:MULTISPECIES: ligase-associated DNA damage response endonuclease PdeM [unclassified Sphingomonas]KQX17521.1 phosphoesterase [Sphingomonas sp. Root1294]KQY70447.1 phosphoesterase [Sphingomonas sp. Root50]KRB92066.1 phosphoesterase [Sphingomonas sp. Root720]